MEENMKTNQIKITGHCAENLFFNHSSHEKDFYKTHVSVPRLDGTEDLLPVIVPESMILTTDVAGHHLEISGEIHTRNWRDNWGCHLCVYVMAKEFILADEKKITGENECILDGFICKRPKIRRTPLGKKIADILIAINRPYRKSDYIPCIAWGRNAVWCSDLEVGAHVRLKGRFQSREYWKEASTGEYEMRTAYEVSANVIERVKNGEEV